MSDFIDVQDIAIRNRIAVDGRVNPTIEDWNNLLTHIDRLEQENAELREALKSLLAKGVDLLNIEDAEDEEGAASIHANFNDELIKLEKLLNK